jgi:uncharacterized membrane protein YkvA (DUF1232 family)
MFEMQSKKQSKKNAKSKTSKKGKQANRDHDDFYQNLRQKIKKWVNYKSGKENKWISYIMVAPDLFHLLCRLTVDKDVPVEHKAKLAVAIAYFVSPIDLIPEMLVGPAGYIDDIAIAAYVLNRMFSEIDPKIIRKHWAGEGDILEIVQSIIQAADDMIGEGLWKKLMSLIDKMKK